jgi:hypothetical protein
VLWAAAGCAESNPRAVVAGDDIGDVSAFAAAVELKAHGGDALCVAVDSAEAPRALIDEADVIVNGAPRLAGVTAAITRLHNVEIVHCGFGVPGPFVGRRHLAEQGKKPA